MQRLTAWVLLSATFLAGCTTPSDEPSSQETAYSHQWAYGPGYGGSDRLPEFTDSFAVTGSQNLTIIIDWAIDAGRAAVVLTPPSREAVNLTDSATGGPQGGAETTINGAAGQWGFRIPTWRDADGEFPAGSVEVQVRT